MRASSYRLFLLAALYASAAFAQERPTNAPIYITHVTVIDTETGKELRDRTVIISGNRISEVRDSNKAKPPTGAKVADGSGKYPSPDSGTCMSMSSSKALRPLISPSCQPRNISSCW